MRIRGAEGLSTEELVRAVEAGGRIVVYTIVLSAGGSVKFGSDPYLIRAGESVLRPAWLPTAVTLLFGWWGFAGLFWTPAALIANLTGGTDVTTGVIAALHARATAMQDTPPPDYEEADPSSALAARVARGDWAGAHAVVRTTRDAGEVLGRDALRTVAHRLQESGDHEAALEVLEALLRASPEEANNGHTAHLVRRSERALGRLHSLVPPPPFLQTRSGLLFVAMTLATAAAVGVGASNEWCRRHADVYVVNATPADLEVELSGERRRVRAGAVEWLWVGEGQRTAVVTRDDGRKDEVALPIHASWRDRFLRPKFVFNVDRAGAIVREQAVYAEASRLERLDADPPQVHIGGPLLVFRGITLPFAPFPQSMRLKSNETRRETRIDLLRGTPTEVLRSFPATLPRAQRLEYLEHRLRAVPDDPATLDAYLDHALGTAEDAGRARAFLRGELTRRPVVPSWHQAYQRVRQMLGEHEEVLEEYVALAAANPDDAAFMALVGRVSPSVREAEPWYRRAATSNPTLAGGHAGLAGVLFARGEWAEARRVLDRALALEPRDEALRSLSRDLRVAAGDHDALVRELDVAFRRSPEDPWLWLRYAESLALRGNRQQVHAALERFRMALQRYTDATAVAFVRWGEFEARVLLEELDDSLVARAEEIGDPRIGLEARFVSRLLTGELAEARSVAPQSPVHLLALAAAFDLAGVRSDADVTRLRAADAFMGSSWSGGRGASALLASSAPPDVDAVIDLGLPRDQTVALLVALAAAHPEASTPLLDAAQVRGAGAVFPYGYLRRVAASLRAR